MVITGVLSSYLWTYFPVFQLTPYGLAIVLSSYCPWLLFQVAIVSGPIVPSPPLFPE
jgi:hypothetical protein